ncbi:MAG: pantoate--beta-alanine ligase [Cyanobacteria bacterium J06632_3]
MREARSAKLLGVVGQFLRSPTVHLFNTSAALREYLHSLSDGRSDAATEPIGHAAGHSTVGFVPTMGALHAGHLSLIERSRRTDDIVVVSIFVNPLQFGPNEDLGSYPRPWDADREICQTAGVDALFMPSPVELYGDAARDPSALTQVVPPKAMMQTLCGRSRPTHFQGVATVVAKLLNIVQPTNAYFGQKDAQQVAILKRLKKDLNIPTKIQVCPIVREADGLALSSRNRYLSEQGRQQATVLYRSLSAAKAAFLQGERNRDGLIQAAERVLAAEPNVKLDYLSLVHPDTLKPLQAIDTVGMMAIAAYVGNPESPTDLTSQQHSKQLETQLEQTPPSRTARLIDNQILTNRAPVVAIDGPAGAGKSTVARQIAHQLGLLYLDTGAMYRALTWFVLQEGVEPTDERAVAQLLPHCQIRLIANVQNDSPQPPKVEVNGQDVTTAIRTSTVTAQVSAIAAQAAVRRKLVEQQQQYGQQGGIVADGRDIGTHVFPNAELKIYLTASVEERAQRRYRDLVAAQQPLPSLADLTEAIAERDRKDSTRLVSPLRKAADAVEIVTDDLTADDVIGKITGLYRQLTRQFT